MEHLSIQVREISHNKDEDRLNDPDLVREPGDQAGREAPYDAYTSPADGHDEERC